MAAVHFLQESGPFLYPILAAGFVLWALVAGQFLVLRRVDLGPLLWAGVVGLLLLGALGSLFGMRMAFQALAQAAPDQRSALMAMGASEAMNCSLVAVTMALPALLGLGVGSTLARHLRRGPGA